MKTHIHIFLLACLVLLTGISQPLSATNGDTLTFNFISEVQTPTAQTLSSFFDTQGRPWVYTASVEGGLLFFDITDIANPSLSHSLSPADFNTLKVMNLTQEGNYLYVAVGTFFGSTQAAGLAIVDVSNPAVPVILDIYEDPVLGDGCASVLIDGNYAYLGGMSDGVLILDVTTPSSISFVNRFLPDPNWPVNNPGLLQYPNARTMQIRNDTLWICFDAGGIRVWDVTDKSAPYEISRYINPSGTNVQQAYNHLILDGDVAYVGVDYCGLEVIDISDPTSLQPLGWWNPFDCARNWPFGVNPWDSSYIHLNELIYLPAYKLILASAGGSELVAVSVADPTNPDSCGAYGMDGNQQAAWGASMRNDQIVLSYIFAVTPYVGLWKGIKILDWETSGVGIGEPIYHNNGLVVRQNYPNPFRTSTQISFELHDPGRVTVEITNAVGQPIATLEDNRLFSSGAQNLQWDGNSDTGAPTPPGIYFAQIHTENTTKVVKMIKVE